MAEQTFSFEDLKSVAAGPLHIKSVSIEAIPSITGKYVFIKKTENPALLRAGMNVKIFREL